MFKLLKKVLSPSSSPAPEDDGERHQARGNELLAAGQFEAAAACYRQAIAFAPTGIEAYTSLAYVLTELKQSDEAARVLANAIALDPANADAHYMLATIARERGNLNDAIAGFENVLAINPQFERAYTDLCGVLDDCGRLDEARSLIAKAISLLPNDARFHYILGTLHAKANAHAEAITCFEQAISLQSDYANLYFHLAVSLYAQGRLEDVVERLQIAIALKPDYFEAYENLGTALLDLNRLDDAILNFHQAILLKPDHAEAHFNQALCMLRQGDFEHGFTEYEWRWKDKRYENARREFIQPLWLGQASLEDKTILLHAEQGLGDTIQFCRYAKLLAAMGATVLLQAPKSLHSLLSDLEGVTRMLEPNQALPQFDFHCPILSLPLAFRTTAVTVPAGIPYLHASPALTSRIGAALGSGKPFRIGICWKGNVTYPRDADRSPGITPFQKLMTGFSTSIAKFHTLLPDSRALVAGLGGEDLGHELDCDTAPFVETAALIMNLDLVITCDTSIGHIAGALGKPVWVVLPFSPDWRWIGDREDSPWYPHTRLFRQTRRGDWNELFERVAVRLNDVLNGSSEAVWPLIKPTQANAVTDRIGE